MGSRDGMSALPSRGRRHPPPPREDTAAGREQVLPRNHTGWRPDLRLPAWSILEQLGLTLCLQHSFPSLCWNVPPLSPTAWLLHIVQAQPKFLLSREAGHGPPNAQ